METFPLLMMTDQLLHQRYKYSSFNSLISLPEMVEQIITKLNGEKMLLSWQYLWLLIPLFKLKSIQVKRRAYHQDKVMPVEASSCMGLSCEPGKHLLDELRTRFFLITSSSTFSPQKYDVLNYYHQRTISKFVYYKYSQFLIRWRPVKILRVPKTICTKRLSIQWCNLSWFWSGVVSQVSYKK